MGLPRSSKKRPQTNHGHCRVKEILAARVRHTNRIEPPDKKQFPEATEHYTF
jgi:hypothetical protein